VARRDIRTLRDAASAAASEGKHRKALECYLELEQLEPGEPNWPKRAAETYRRLNKNREAIAAYDRAADRYVQGGFLVQAIAVCKIILQIDPTHEATKSRLASITEQQDSSRSQAGALVDRHRAYGSDPPPPAPSSRLSQAIAAIDLPSRAAIDLPPSQASEPGLVVAPPLDELDTGVLEIEPTSHASQVITTPVVTRRQPATPPGVYSIPDDTPSIDDLSLDDALNNEAVREGRASETTQTGKRKPLSGPILLDPGAPLDSVALASAMPGAQPQLRFDGSTSGIIVIPIDDEPIDENGEMPSVEIETISVGPEQDGSPEMAMDGATEDPVELAVEDLEEIPDLAEPRPYSAAARKALGQTPLFAALPPAALEDLIDRMSLVELTDGQVLFRQGDPGDALYVVTEGGVVVISEGPPRQELTRMGPGSFFGEVALVTEEPRSATIIAEGDTQLLSIDRNALRMLVGSYPDVLPVILRFLRDRLVDRLVKTHPLFSSFGEHDRAYLVAHFRFLEIEAGAVVVQDRARPQGLYALLAGKVEVTAGDKRLAILGPGDLFGEDSLLTGKPSSVTITASVRCLALCLPAADFREIIMTHPQVLSYIGDLVDERSKQKSVPQF
jgi:cAMP-dependent protein kinase regulator